MSMKLIFTSGPLEGRRFRVDGRIVLGRDPSNDIVLSDPAVSLVHCQVYFDGDRVYAKDLGSTNGIRVNGRRLISSELRDGDGMTLGKSKIRVEISGVAKGAPHDTTVTAVDFVQEEEPAEEATIIRDPSEGVEELSGNIFGQVTYFLKRKIADGGMGSVYEAEQFGAEGFIKKVAIKTILPRYVEKESFVSSFIGEAKLVANLVHQNIVQIHHLGRHDRGYYISMEYIDGINMTSFLARHARQRRSVPVEIATFVASRVCRGLEYAHSKRGESGESLELVHRDVSPNNIMITREGEVKLTDFGVAKAAQFMEDSDGYLVGSVEYMAPEQAACESVDGRSDLFALGLLYYELLSGVRVFQCLNDDIDETVERVMAAKVPDIRKYRPDLSDGIVKIVGQCLQKDPDQRYQSASELGYALEHEMYSKGYGPTIVTLAGYLQGLDQAGAHHDSKTIRER